MWRSTSPTCGSSWRTAAGRCTWKRHSSSCPASPMSGSTAPASRRGSSWSTSPASRRSWAGRCGARTGRARASRTSARTSISPSNCRSPRTSSGRSSRPMRWLSFLLLANGTAAAQSAPARAAKPLRFDFTLVAPIRDSFVFHVRGEERGWAVWQYELRSDEMRQEVLYTATSEVRPVEAESLRIVVDRLTGAPVASYQRLDFSAAHVGSVFQLQRVAAGRDEVEPLIRRDRSARQAVGGEAQALDNTTSQ